MATASPLEFALIGLLKQQPQSGYDLRKAFATTPMRHFSDSPGSIYPALRRLQTRKWVSAASQERGRKRQLFRVLPPGNRAFTEWLKLKPTREDVIWRMGEVMLRFAFQGGNVARDVSLDFLAQLEQQLESYLRELRGFAKQSGLSAAVSTGSLAFDCGLKEYEAQLSWTKQARRKLKEAPL